MDKIINLPDNLINLEDRQRLESFGGHLISHGRATRWHWSQSADDERIFEIYRGGVDECLEIFIQRNRAEDVYNAYDRHDELVVSGALDHVMAVLDQYFISLHDDQPDPPA